MNEGNLYTSPQADLALADAGGERAAAMSTGLQPSCTYGMSQTAFRGPARSLDAPYVACLGGTEFQGKFIDRPIPDLLEDRIAVPCINLGVHNGGADVFAGDSTLLHIASQSRLCLLQITGAHNLSNRFYAVHPRRNDRLTEPSHLLRSVFPEVDFSSIHFTRHALEELMRVSPSRFRVLVDELKAAWVSRMTLLLNRIAAPTLLVWIGDHDPSDAGDRSMRDPLFVDQAMLDMLIPQSAGLVTCTIPAEVTAEDQAQLALPMVPKGAARHLFGPAAHAHVAAALEAPVRAALARERSIDAPRDRPSIANPRYA